MISQSQIISRANINGSANSSKKGISTNKGKSTSSVMMGGIPDEFDYSSTPNDSIFVCENRVKRNNGDAGNSSFLKRANFAKKRSQSGCIISNTPYFHPMNLYCFVQASSSPNRHSSSNRTLYLAPANEAGSDPLLSRLIPIARKTSTQRKVPSN